MIFFLSDHDIELYVQVLWSQFRKSDWEDFGVGGYLTFFDLGIDPWSTDRTVWQFCQENSLLLITGNRNMDGVNSLEAVIRELNRPHSWPIVTIGRPEAVMEASYREQCAYRLADIVTNLQSLLGTGRQVIP